MNTGSFAFEVKFGKAYCSKMIRSLITQVEEEAPAGQTRVVLVKPHREEPYVILPFSDFEKILK